MYDNCHLEESASNDGDSFWMKYTRPGYGRRYFIRLYFVDCPESDASFPDRVAEQAKWWNIPEEDVVRLGKEAKKFTADFLEKGFVVHSKLQDARGRSDKKRNYANVRVGEVYLAEALLENGLARIYGFQETGSDEPKASTLLMRLKAAENKGQQARRGVWGVGAPASGPGFPRAPVRAPVESALQALQSKPTLSSMREPPPPEDPVSAPASSGRTYPAEVKLTGHLRVYSLKDGRYVDSLRPGHDVRLLEKTNADMVKVRFVWGTQTIEAQVREADLDSAAP